MKIPKQIENTGYTHCPVGLLGLGPTFYFIPDKLPKHRTVRLNTGHLATLHVLL